MFGRIVDRIATGAKNMAKADHLSVDDPKAVKGIEALVDGLGMALGLPYSGPMQSVKAVAGMAGAPLVQGSTAQGGGASTMRSGHLPPPYRPLPPLPAPRIASRSALMPARVRLPAVKYQ
jgi:hypothetical protein